MIESQVVVLLRRCIPPKPISQHLTWAGRTGGGKNPLPDRMAAALTECMNEGERTRLAKMVAR